MTSVPVQELVVKPTGVGVGRRVGQRRRRLRAGAPVAGRVRAAEAAGARPARPATTTLPVSNAAPRLCLPVRKTQHARAARQL